MAWSLVISAFQSDWWNREESSPWYRPKARPAV